jgi:predicted TIM-barrel fold metal-dependent hydrolase
MNQTDIRRPEAGPVATLIDCDVHVYLANGLRDTMPYMSRAYQERFAIKGRDVAEDAMSLRFANPHEGGALRRDAIPPGGGSPASDPGFLVQDHLDRFGVDCALINNPQVLSLAAIQAAPDESVALCSAANDYFVETWLPVDERFRYGFVIPAQDPEAAAREIHRMAAIDRVSAAYYPLTHMAMGHRFNYPIYAAAQETGIPLVIHPTSCDFIYQGAGTYPAGLAESYCEFYAALPVLAWSHLTSLVATGTFERFPGLKVAFIEFGFSWVPPMLWRLDKAWEGSRFEVPWVKRPPSDYVRDQVCFGTQPLDEPRSGPDHLEQVIAMLGPDALIFSSDYPHWDGDNATRVLAGISDDVRRQIRSTNAERFFGFGVDVA